jgi:hypothetical protein
MPICEKPEGNGGVATADLSKRDHFSRKRHGLIVANQQFYFIDSAKIFLGYKPGPDDGRSSLEIGRIIGPNEGSKARQVLIPRRLSFGQF